MRVVTVMGPDPEMPGVTEFRWWALRDSNPRPSP